MRWRPIVFIRLDIIRLEEAGVGVLSLSRDDGGRLLFL